MATNQVIKLKRGTTTPTTGNISSGEVAIDTSAQKFYVNDGGVVKEVGGVPTSITGTTSIYNTALKVGRDSGGDWIDFGTDSNIGVYLNNAEEFRFASGGTFHADADIVAYSTTVASDAALKYNINPVENALDKLNCLDGVTFQWKRDNKVSAGVIAQDVEKVMPSAVKEVESLNGDSTHKAVDYNQIIALLVEAVKDQQKQIDELRK